jgi:hypothetical protein
MEIVMSKHQFTDEQLLNMAKGVPQSDDEREMLDQAAHVAKWMEIPEKSKYLLTKRREIRRGIFTIIKRLRRNLEITPELKALMSIIEPQLNADLQMTWATFTFNWDIHPFETTTVIQKHEWFSAGGRYDELGSLEPPAFTEQEIS